ncbi:MAG TPA: type VI secretion protein ImpB [Beijerinckiaceae bacterium]
MRKPTGVERLYIDFDSFFATAEQHLRPELRGRPVGVIPLDTPHTGLIAASREAKRHGVKRGLWVREARRLCPGIVIVPARHEAYVRLHKAIVQAVERVLPVLAVRSIDEMVCALAGDEQGRAVAVARAVKASIAQRVGPDLTCSAGLGPNELLAKIAAEMEKPDGLVALRPEDLPGRLLDLKLTDIPGIASRNAARLERAGVKDVAALWGMAGKHARAVWGSVEGERLWASLHGYAVEAPKTARVMYGHGRVLPNDWRTPEKVHACARFLAVKAARRMRREGFAARALALWFTDRRSAGWFGEDSFAPAFDDRTILASLSRLVEAARTGGAPALSRSVHVVLHDLVPIGEVPRDLFEREAEHERRRRFERLSLIADSLNGRYGRAVLHLGPLVEPPGGYAGAKIAFNRIPEEADF